MADDGELPLGRNILAVPVPVPGDDTKGPQKVLAVDSDSAHPAQTPPASPSPTIHSEDLLLVTNKAGPSDDDDLLCLALDGVCISDVSDSPPLSDEDDDSDDSLLSLPSTEARPLVDLPDQLCSPGLASEQQPLPEAGDARSTTDSLGPEHDHVKPMKHKAPEEEPAQLAADSARDIFQDECLVISQSSIAGWGAFAARDLTFGERILVEKPLFIADWRTLYAEFNKLDQAHQSIVMSLHANGLSKLGTSALESVWNTNCFAVSNTGAAGLFPIAARFNHACAPRDNVGYRYNRAEGCLEMHVKAPRIPAGQELTISYGNRRPLDLYLKYGFRCKCGACAGLGDGQLGDWERRQWLGNW